MNVEFVKLSPTQNITVLVTSHVARELQPAVAGQLMDYSNVYAEQVGYLEDPVDPRAAVRLQMMGGEFCGNATMACASYLASLRGLDDGCEIDIPLEVSGADGLINCHITRQKSAYYGTVRMPLPDSIREITFKTGIRCPVVFFPGIAHAILEDHGEDDTDKISAMCAELNAEAFGIVRCSSDKTRIRPLVYVASTRTSVYERGCGSGSSAFIALHAYKNKAGLTLDISQPGGVIRASAEYSEGRVTDVRITGKVTIAATGTAFIEL